MYKSFKCVSPHAGTTLAKFSIVDDELEKPIIVGAHTLWEAIIIAYKDKAVLNIIQLCRIRGKQVGFQEAIRECKQYIPEFMKRPEVEKYLMLI